MKAYPWCCRHHPVGENKQIQAHQLENVLKKPDDLQGEHVLQEAQQKTKSASSHKHHGCDACDHRPYLSAVVSNLKDGRLPADPARPVRVLLIDWIWGAAQTLPLQFTHAAALHLELGQVGGLCSATATQQPHKEKQHLVRVWWRTTTPPWWKRNELPTTYLIRNEKTSILRWTKALLLPLHGCSWFVVNVQHHSFRVTGQVAAWREDTNRAEENLLESYFKTVRRHFITHSDSY